MDLNLLKEHKIPEGKNLEYKGSLDFDNPRHKEKLLKTICAFANTNGGLLIYGIDAKDGIPTEIKGISVDNQDETGMRIIDIIKENSEPSIPSISVGFRDKSDSNNVFILIKVSRSWNSPHRVSISNNKKLKHFYIRGDFQNNLMDIFELRTSFNLSETLGEKIKRFREERISSILSNETPISLKTGGKLILHLIPINAFYPGQKYNIGQIKDLINKLTAIDAHNPRFRINFDGYLTSESIDDYANGSYAQLYRNGIIEAVCGDFFNAEKKLMSSSYYEIQVVRAFSNYLEIYKEINVELPVFIFITLVDVKGYKMEPDNNEFFLSHRKEGLIDRNVLANPEILMSKYPEIPGNLLKPAFDAFRNACGFRGSGNYNDEGEWNPKRR